MSEVADLPPELGAKATHRYDLLFPGINDPHFLVLGRRADETAISVPADIVDHI